MTTPLTAFNTFYICNLIADKGCYTVTSYRSFCLCHGKSIIFNHVNLSGDDRQNVRIFISN